MLSLPSIRGSAEKRRAATTAVLALFGLLSPSLAHAYIGPGAGFAVLGSFLAMLAAVTLGGLVLLTWPVRSLLRARRWSRLTRHVDRVVVLGFDGMDPAIVDAMVAAGRLPHLARLRDAGTYYRLETTCPAMSPVAWSSFITGTGPGRHGIFDFLHRDPRTYLPLLSSAQIRPPRRMLRLGRLRFPLGRPFLRVLRRSRTFWSVLSEHGVFSTILRVPITFPPEPFGGLLLSGMCVPDLRGTQGSFTLFTSTEEAPVNLVGGLRIRLARHDGAFRGALPGPALPGSDGDAAEAPFRLRPGGDGIAHLEISGLRVALRVGEYSDWVPVTFRAGPGARVSGICRCYLKRVTPDVELYFSPINIDPERPALPVSHPVTYSIYLAKRLGRYGTLGLAEDTWALNEGAIDEGAFLGQCQLLFEERERMLFNALANTRRGCIVCVFDTADRIQHMFWRYRAGEHPASPEQKPGRFGQAVEAAYEQADAVVGKVMSQLGDRDALVILSDHGFRAFRRGVNVNAWLLQQGYLALKPNANGAAEWLRDVDWERTRAYAVGLAGIYLNIRGREARGAVHAAEVPALKQELAERLSGLVDEETGDVAIARVLDSAAVNPGPYVDSGPDLIVGYAPGYRASWDGARGRAVGSVVEDNTRRWAGDHCVDPRYVPGVLFSSLRLGAAAARIMDIAPTILDLFGITPPSYMEGRSLLVTSRPDGVGLERVQGAT